MADKEEKGFKLPKYLKLAKGSMWFDTEGENASGVRVYASNTTLIGRGTTVGREDNIPKDKFDNQNLVSFGYKEDKSIPIFIDTSTIPAAKLSRIIMAFKNGVLEKTDLKNNTEDEEFKQSKDFMINKAGDKVFVGKNKEMYKKLQNLPFQDLKLFINGMPRSEMSKNNLMDMYHYEVLGYNAMSRARLEVIDLIRAKLKEYGPTMSVITKNEED